jgi:hypothetical protein
VGAQGHAIVDFGASYRTDASLAITGQAAILGSSFVEAWLDATVAATADHTPDEHVIEAPWIGVTCSDIVAGTGFTIRLAAGGPYSMYGEWNVSWVWA